MRLKLEGNINVYYVQTLCMIFFPGEKFGATEQENPDSPELSLKLVQSEEGMTAEVFVSCKQKTAQATKTLPFTEYYDKEKTAKMACGAAIVAACGELKGYRPSWGMLTGVRPS